MNHEIISIIAQVNLNLYSQCTYTLLLYLYYVEYDARVHVQFACLFLYICAQCTQVHIFILYIISNWHIACNSTIAVFNFTKIPLNNFFANIV